MTGLLFLVGTQTGLYTGGAFGSDIVQMVLHAGPVVKFVLFILFFLSVVSWAIIFLKLRLLGKARRETDDFLRLFWENRDFRKIHQGSEDMSFSPVARLFHAGYKEYSRIRRIQSHGDSENIPEAHTIEESARSQRAVMDNLERSIRKGTIDQVHRLEKAVSFLATTGNAAPFIGLFGTVWGIMESFRGIGLKGSANLSVVAPGISEALIATAAGLAAAIPAVVAFNYFTRRVGDLRADMDIFASDFLSIVERQFFRKPPAKAIS